MRDAAASALRFIEGRKRADLDCDEMLLFALVRAVEVIGEAATKVSVEGRTGVPDIRWAAIVGMRNRLVHAYFDGAATSSMVKETARPSPRRRRDCNGISPVGTGAAVEH